MTLNLKTNCVEHTVLKEYKDRILFKLPHLYLLQRYPKYP